MLPGGGKDLSCFKCLGLKISGRPAFMSNCVLFLYRDGVREPGVYSLCIHASIHSVYIYIYIYIHMCINK